MKYVDPSGHCWGFASGLRNTFYQTTCENIDQAVSIIQHPDASVGEKALAVTYVGVEALAHGTVVVGTGMAAGGCLTGAGTVVCTGAGSAVTAASADGDPTNEVQGIAQALCGDGDCTNEASAASRALGQLRQVGQNIWESTSGLRYGPDFRYGNRVQHVLRHAVDDAGRRIHGVFSGGRSQVLPLIDEAWQSVQQGTNITSVTQQGSRTVYVVDMGKTVGYVGGQVGAAAGYPITNYIRIVVEGANEIITAYPVIPVTP